MNRLCLQIVSGLLTTFLCLGFGQIKKPSPEAALKILRVGNDRFSTGKSKFPNISKERMLQAGKENQKNFAYATIVSCSDSRVPVEYIFDAGIMDLFVIRVAGNVCDTDEIGSIEYGIAHVNTPVLVILGHTQCGAVTAVTEQIEGHSHEFEKNIPPLVDNIIPAVKNAKAKNPQAEGEKLIAAAIFENIWQGFEDLFMKSPASRRMVKTGKVKAVGAIYDVSTGKVSWLPEAEISKILDKVERNPKKALESGNH